MPYDTGVQKLIGKSNRCVPRFDKGFLFCLFTGPSLTVPASAWGCVGESVGSAVAVRGMRARRGGEGAGGRWEGDVAGAGSHGHNEAFVGVGVVCSQGVAMS